MKYRIILPLLLIVTGCASYPNAVIETGQVRHVVICWLKPGADRAAIVQSCEELSQIPGVVEITVGDKIASDRPVVDSSYDLAVSITFDNVASLRAYDAHPIHLKILERVVKPNVEKFVIYDSTIDFYTFGKIVDEDIASRRRAAFKKQREIIDNAH